MKTYRQMIRVLNACMRVNMWKALFSFLLMSVLETLVMSFFSGPVIMLLAKGGVSLFPVAASVALLFMGFVFVMFLQYGYQVLLLRILRGEFVTLGFLFSGFKDRKRILRASSLFSLGMITSLVICQILALIINLNFEKNIQALKFSVLVGIIFIVYTLICAVLLIRFVFVWVCLYDNPGSKVADVFKMSAAMLKGRCFKLAGFILYAGGIYLLTAVSAFLLSLLIPRDLKGLPAFLFSVTEFVYFVSAYTAAVRMFMSVPLFYTEVLAVSGAGVKNERKALESPADMGGAENPCGADPRESGSVNMGGDSDGGAAGSGGNGDSDGRAPADGRNVQNPRSSDSDNGALNRRGADSSESPTVDEKN
ncbi:hypothetical protein [Treponema parvum]|uniref:hypothetical protein n=1 Tax=Treponema parvum TaxID=138851 RepID=UPI001AEC4740|nr:hypothetical protein [Treponema parvum]QTQ16854.1 hypothetical protein HXT04_09210 [Treponema parvum]